MVTHDMERYKRMLVHAWLEAVSKQYPMSHAALERLGQHVRQCEKKHSGEIRVYIETALPWAILKQNLPTRVLSRQRAIEIFSSQRVWDTAQNNGVLIYLLLAERAIEIIADRGLNQRVTPVVWEEMVSRLSDACREGAIEAGLVRAVTEVSALLGQHFSLAEGDLNPNELPDLPMVGE